MSNEQEETVEGDEGVVSPLDRLLSGTRAALNMTAKASKERIKQRQDDRNLDKLYWKLGKEVVELVRAEEIDHPGVQNAVEGIEVLLKDRALR
jgi:hypothetical protein